MANQQQDGPLGPDVAVTHILVVADAVTFRPPADPDLVSHAMTLRVADCQAAYEALRSRGASFLTPPHDWGQEIRCFLRDPDGHLVEISEAKAGGSLPAMGNQVARLGLRMRFAVEFMELLIGRPHNSQAVTVPVGVLGEP